MTDEKNIDAEKKESQPQEKFADERLTDEQLDKVAGGHAIEDHPKLLSKKNAVQGGPSGK